MKKKSPSSKVVRKSVKSAATSQTEELKLLRRIANLTSSELDLSTVLSDVVDMVAHVCDADSVFIYLFNEKRDSLTLRASKVPHRKAMGKVALRMGEGITGWVAKENKPVAIKKNAYLDPRFKTFDILPEDRYESFLSVPIVFKGRPIGVMNIQHHDPQQYSDRLVSLLATVASQVGGIIENARLYEDTKRKAHQFDSLVKISQGITSEKYLDEILRLVVAVTAEMLHSKICSIMLLDDKGEQLIVKATQSLSEAFKNRPPLKVKDSLSGEVIQSKTPRVVYDVTRESKYVLRDLAAQENLSSMLLIPMVIKDKSIGLLTVYTENPHDFSQEEINALQMTANQAAVAIENTKLMEETLKMKEALETKKLIERAQAVLMKMNNMGADAAYRLIHKKSMDSCRPMKAIAEAILLASELSAAH